MSRLIALLAVLVMATTTATAPVSANYPMHMPAKEATPVTSDLIVRQATPVAQAVTTPMFEHIKFTFVGDCMIASDFGEAKPGNFQAKANEGDPTWFLGGVMPMFEDDDFTVVNVENVLTDRPLKKTAKNYSPAYWYKAPTKNMEILTSSSVEICNLSNNHTGDYGAEGAADTIQAVLDYGLDYGNNDRTVYVEKAGFCVAIICNGLWYEGQEDIIIKRLRAAEEHSDLQVVYYHGGTERVHKPEDWRVRASHRLIDAGADLVIGNHPHVLQPIETYKGKPILYSLGNFCFGGSYHPENATMIYRYNITLINGEFAVANGYVTPCYVYTGSQNNWRPEIMPEGKDRQNVLDFLAGKRSSPV